MHELLRAALPATAFFARLPDLGVLQVTGSDARKFLQGQITQDIATLSPNQHRLGACCNAQGRILSLFRVLVVGESAQEQVLLLMPRPVIALLLESIKKYAVFFKVQMLDVSQQWFISGVVGAPAVAEAGNASSIEQGYCLQLDATRQLFLQHQPASLTWSERPASDWGLAEIIAGEPAVLANTVATLLPHSLDLPRLGAISFSKGCYTGQEIIARMEYKGKLKTHLYQLLNRSSEEITAGIEILGDDKSLGSVVRAAALPDGGQLLLASLHESAESATSLRAQTAHTPILELIR